MRNFGRDVRSSRRSRPSFSSPHFFSRTSLLSVAAKESDKIQNTRRERRTMISCNAYKKTSSYDQQQTRLPPPRPPKPEKLKYKYSCIAPPVHPRKLDQPEIADAVSSSKWKPTPFPRLSLLKKKFENPHSTLKPLVHSQRPVGVAMRFPMVAMAVSVDASPYSVAQKTSPGSKDSGLTQSGSSAITEERSFDDDFVRRIKRWDSQSSRSDDRSVKNANFEIPSTSSLEAEEVNNDFFDCQGLEAELLKIEQERLQALIQDDQESSVSNFTSITNQPLLSEAGSEQRAATTRPNSLLAHFNANAKVVSSMEKNMRVMQWIHCCSKALKTSTFN